LKTQRIQLVLLAALVTTFGSIGYANRVVGDVISGSLTAVNQESVTINGHAYHVGSGSPAATAVRNLNPGDVVEVHLNGPVQSSSSEVINIIRHPAP
jgi:hypothetical protein